MLNRWLGAVAVMGVVLVGCGGTSVEDEASPTASAQQPLRYCDAQYPCPSGQVCAESACRPACDYDAQNCAAGYTCCMGYWNPDGTGVSPYCSTICFYP